MAVFQGKGFCFPLNQRTYIMGILNITADSFFDGGKWNSPQRALEHALQMERDGADILDIGAQSTRPGHIPMTDAEELAVLQTYLPQIAEKVKIPISIDTFFPRVAEYALANGASIVNDVSGVFHTDMAQVVKAHSAGWVVMHSGKSDSDNAVQYKNGVVEDVKAFFSEMQEKCLSIGISPEQLCYDIGIGFGKERTDDMALLRHLAEIKQPNRALMTALSCKRVIAQYTGADGEERLFGTLSANTLAIAGGTDFIRVHHVRENKLAAKMADAIVRAEG